MPVEMPQLPNALFHPDTPPISFASIQLPHFLEQQSSSSHEDQPTVDSVDHSLLLQTENRVLQEIQCTASPQRLSGIAQPSREYHDLQLITVKVMVDTEKEKKLQRMDPSMQVENFVSDEDAEG